MTKYYIDISCLRTDLRIIRSSSL